MSSHRRMAHGFDAVAEVLSGVPGYQPTFAGFGEVRKQSPPPEQMELTGA